MAGEAAAGEAAAPGASSAAPSVTQSRRRIAGRETRAARVGGPIGIVSRYRLCAAICLASDGAPGRKREGAGRPARPLGTSGLASAKLAGGLFAPFAACRAAAFAYACAGVA